MKYPSPSAANSFRSWLVFSMALAATLGARASETILFIGNSFTFADFSPVQHYRPESVTDLNDTHIGGVPALFKRFTAEAGLDYIVSLETHPGIGLDWHLAHESAVIAKPFDHVVMHGYSTLDKNKPGDPGLLTQTVAQTADLLHKSNAKVEIWLMSTWARPDQIYPDGKPWHGKSIATMTLDLRKGYDAAAANSPSVHGVIPVGQAFSRAVDVGVADPNPFDGITPGQIDLWNKDHYHGSTEGYYLEALVVFGTVTHLDPRFLGKTEQAAADLGLPPALVEKLEKIAADTITAEPSKPTLKSFSPKTTSR